jgi:uncharacterized membrane protein (TIGR02234 family)
MSEPQDTPDAPGADDPVDAAASAPRGAQGPDTQADAGSRRPRLARRTVVLTGLVAAGALAATTRATWVQASAPDLAGTSQDIAVSGADAAPAVLALALAALAAALATSLSSRWVRFLTGPVLIAAGLGAGLSALGPARAPEQAARSAVAESTGVVGAGVSAVATAWPLLCLVPALAVVLTGVIVLAVGRSWPVGSRYRSAAVTAAADPADDPAAAWDALTRGEDPSLAGPDGAAPEDEPAPAQEPGPDVERPEPPAAR